VLKDNKPMEVPTEHVPTRRKAAEAKFADLLDQVTANLERCLSAVTSWCADGSRACSFVTRARAWPGPLV
jgi:hypothetical protein